MTMYNLRDKNNGAWLARWPSAGGAPANWTHNRSEAVEFSIGQFDGLAGYWDYARHECTCVATCWDVVARRFLTVGEPAHA